MELYVVGGGNGKSDEEIKGDAKTAIDKTVKIVQNKIAHGGLNYPINSLHFIQDGINTGAKKFSVVYKNNKMRIV